MGIEDIGRGKKSKGEGHKGWDYEREWNVLNSNKKHWK